MTKYQPGCFDDFDPADKPKQVTMRDEICECDHHWSTHRDKGYDADVAGSMPGQGSCTEKDCPCKSFRPKPATDGGDADSYGNRALKCLDYRLTGAEAVIALSVMHEFAELETARLQRELSNALAEIERYKAMVAGTKEISGDEWLISTKPGLFALRVFAGGETAKYLHFESALEAFESLAATDSTEGDSTGAGEEENESKSLD